ncbi:MlaA family lipoprotein [Pseudomonas atacamensis]|uniref:MlaA family lipoprotein n=1 Tax=Pseudomonas atacamensis TaxID=2565368 RepID=UPI00244BAAD6|nr:VacJ family lipoprotein [Pseudomonas atacamensis]MDH2076831.1 VacJ family lipoprotein [Pseudomonas atacamensis]
MAVNFGMRLAGAALIAACSVSAYANTNDPWESVNRKTFAFNETIDRYALKPIASGYVAVTPEVVQAGVHNFFQNIGDVTNLANDALQGNGRSAGVDLTRLMLNTTVGVAGLFDVATTMGLERNDQDFGLTLGHWVTSGPYVVVPLLGPSTVRDAVAIMPDDYTGPYPYIKNVRVRNSLHGVDLLDTRATLLPAEKLIQGDPYTFIRNAYMDQREFQLSGKQVKDDF